MTIELSLYIVNLLTKILANLLARTNLLYIMPIELMFETLYRRSSKCAEISYCPSIQTAFQRAESFHVCDMTHCTQHDSFIRVT